MVILFHGNAITIDFFTIYCKKSMVRLLPYNTIYCYHGMPTLGGVRFADTLTGPVTSCNTFQPTIFDPICAAVIQRSYKPYQNKIICWNNFICYSLNFFVFCCFCWVSQIKSEMIMSKLWIRISSWFVVPFFGIRIKWVYGFGCFVFSAFI